ncbi:CvpA family protein [Comamonas serinivorans]|uniref:CvpA family protein n=1 Tax=Comamonas serinivorans TaxID=1082851 RepID=UPI0012FBEA86|nr:CvpA family protein [Comamonas serinivorans]
MTGWPAGNGLDLALLGVLLWSALVGAWRGLVFEVVSLASWVLALMAAWLFADSVARALPWQDLPPGVLHGLGFGLVLLGVRLVLKLLALALRSVIQGSVLSGMDRGLGAVFGMLRGGLLLGLVSLVVLMTPLRDAATWKASFVAAWLTQGVLAARPWVSPELQSLWPQEGRAAGTGV